MGGLGRIPVKPTASNTDPAFCKDVVEDVTAVLDSAQLEVDHVERVFAAGPYVYVADGHEGIMTDLTRTVGVTAGLVLVVLALGMRSVRAPLVLGVPVLISAILQLSALSLLFGSLNTFTSFGTALLVGLGLDSGIHLWMRTRELRRDGLEVEDAIACAWDTVGPACVTATLTSAAGFAVLGLAEFRGLAHLGISLAIGLVLCLVATGVLLPILLRAFDRRLPRIRPRPAVRPTPRRTSVIGLVVLLLVGGGASVFGAFNLRFQHDITLMNRDRMAFSKLDEATRELVRQAYPPVVVTLPDADAAAAAHQRLDDARRAGELPHVGQVLSVAGLLPRGRRDQLPDAVVALLGGPNRVLLRPQGDLYDLRESSAFIDELAPHAPDAASEQLAQGAVYRAMVRDTPWIVGAALGLVGLLVLADLRKTPILAAAALASLTLGLGIAAGACALLGVELTLMNLIGLPVLLGIGIDVVLHFAHRLRDQAGLRTVGGAAALSTVTTLASFIALTTASSGGIRSVGMLIVVGLSAVTLTSAIALPLFMAVLRPAQAPSDP